MLILICSALAGESSSLPVEARANDVVPESAPDGSGLHFLGVFSARASFTDVSTTNPLVNGQVVGELGGTNSTTTDSSVGAYTEERVGAFFRYAPPLLGGRAALDAAFEVDFAFGDQSYSVGGNTGGAFGADQVNLQTRRLAGRFEWFKKQNLVAGLQFVADGVNDPGVSRLDDLTRSGGRLMVVGSEAAGVTAFGKVGTPSAELLRYRIGAYTLYEQAFALGDDVSLWMADVQFAPAYATRIGVHAWTLRDRAGGEAGIVGSGPSSALSELQGGPRLDFRTSADEAAPEVDTDLVWTGVDAGYNAALDMGPVGVHAVALVNSGQIYVADHGDVGVLGLLIDVEGRWRYAPGDGSYARLEAVYTSGDQDGDATYTGFLTANTWGIVGAVYATHGCYLLFPDAGAISRAVSIVPDVSAKGLGLIGVSASAGYEPIPNRLGLTLGAGHARTASGNTLGTEFNGRVGYKPFVLGQLSVVGAAVVGSELPVNPWLTMITFDWLMIP